MTILFVLFGIVFPVGAIIPIKRIVDGKLCSKEYCSVIKGIATCFVMISHLTILLGSKYNTGVFKLFDVLGGMGVLLFFFLSGYGLFVGYYGKENYMSYLIKRLNNVVIPYLILKVIFWVIKCIAGKALSFGVLLAGFDDWFIDVILIQYIIFLICWKIFGKNARMLIGVIFVSNVALSLFFMALKFNPRWYNALLMFPIGMIFAALKGKLHDIIVSHRILTLIVPAVLFMGFGGGFAVLKQAQFSGILKICAGVFLSAVVFRLSSSIELRSSVMRYIGNNSLYFYIIHLEILKLIEGYYEIDPVIACYIILAGAFVGVPLFSGGYNLVRSKLAKGDKN